MAEFMDSNKMIGAAWDVYSKQVAQGKLRVVSFDVELAQESAHEGYGHCVQVVITIPVNYVQDNGLPVDDSFQYLRQLEGRLLRLLAEKNVACRFVGRIIVDGKQEMVFQTDDVAEFTAAAAPMLETESAYRIELRDQPGWTYFDEHIRPSVRELRLIEDRKLLGKLFKMGANPGKTHVLEHTFTGPEEKLKALRAILLEQGFTAVSLGNDRMVLEQETQLYPDLIFAGSERLLDLCEAQGVSYQGWGTAAVE